MHKDEKYFTESVSVTPRNSFSIASDFTTTSTPCSRSRVTLEMDQASTVQDMPELADALRRTAIAEDERKSHSLRALRRRREVVDVMVSQGVYVGI